MKNITIKKKILSIFALVLCVFMMCGCGSVAYQISYNSDSSVTETYTVAVDKDALSASGKTYADVFAKATDSANAYITNLLQKFKLRTTDENDVTYVVEHIDPKPTVVGGGISGKMKPTIKENYFQFSITFLDRKAYNLFYGVEELNANQTEKLEKHLFYTKQIVTRKTPFSTLDGSDIANDWISYFGNESLYNLGALDNYIYAYSTYSEKVYSNAQQVGYDASGNKVHIWVFGADEVKSTDPNKCQIVLYQIYINPIAWYVLAIVLTLILALILVLVCVVKNKKKQSNTSSGGPQKFTIYTGEDANNVPKN